MGREVRTWHWGLSVATGPQRAGVGDGGAPLLPNPSTEHREHVPPALCVEFLSFPVPPPRNLGIGEEQQGCSACVAFLCPMLDACTYIHTLYIHTYTCPHTLHTHMCTHTLYIYTYMCPHILHMHTRVHTHCIYTHTCTHTVYICTHTLYICIYTYTCIYIYTYTCPHTLHTHVYPHSIYICIHTLYICIYTCTHIIYAHTHVYTLYICAHTCTHTSYMCSYMCTRHMCTHHIYAHTCIHTLYVCTHTCTHITYICVCIHIYTHIFPPQTFFQLSPSVVVSPWMFCMIILSFIINFDDLSFFRCLF